MQEKQAGKTVVVVTSQSDQSQICRFVLSNRQDVIGQLMGIYRMLLVEDYETTGCDWLTLQRRLHANS